MSPVSECVDPRPRTRTCAERDLPRYPSRVQVGLTARCNIQCIMCLRHVEQQPVPPDMPWEFWERVRDSLPHAKRVIFGAPGDPLVYPRIREVLVDLRGLEGVHRVFVTNGKRLADDRIRELVEQSVDQIGISLEGVTPESYVRTRKGANFERLVTALRKLDTDRVKLVLKTIPMRHNLHELPDLVRLAADLGASHIACQHLNCLAGMEDIYHEYSIWDRPQQWNDVQAECRELARQFGITLNWPGPLVDHGRPDDRNPLGVEEDQKERFIDPTTKCYEPWEYARYGPLTSGACCHTSGADHRDYDDVVSMWRAPQIRALRATVNDPDQTRWHPRCRTCQRRMR